MSAEGLVYSSGDFIPASQAGIRLNDPGIGYGHMVFEVTRTYHHKAFRLAQHLERLYASMKSSEIDCGMTLEEMAEATLLTIKRNIDRFDPDDDVYIVHNVSNGPVGAAQPTVTINVESLADALVERSPFFETGVHAVITTQRSIPARLQDPKVKSRSRIHYALATIEAKRISPQAWALLTDDDGYVTEGSFNNFLMVSDGELISPEPRNILLGVTRGDIVELAAKLAIPYREKNIGVYEVINADEAFYCGTTHVIMPVCRVNGHPIGSSVPGPVTRKLSQAFKELVGLDYEAQAMRYAAQADAETLDPPMDTRPPTG
jgi:branched-chain amino acid aminotransferase